jgi:hypothetical protein
MPRLAPVTSVQVVTADTLLRSRSGTQARVKVFISADVEGRAGVVDARHRRVNRCG